MPTLTLPNVDAPEPQVSKHELTRFIAGELPQARRAEIAALLASDAALKAKHDAIVADDAAAFAALKLEVPLERFLDDHASRMTAQSPVSSFVAALFGALKSGRVQLGLGTLAAAAVLVVVVTRPGDGQPQYDGLKGGARVGFFVRDSRAAHTGRDGEELGAGDQIQFAVRDDVEHTAMVLVGVDGRGEVTVYDAESLERERPKGDGKPRLLPDSVVLDDSTGAERFFVVYGDADVDTLKAQVQAAAQELASSHADLSSTERLPLSTSFVQSSVHIVKVSR